MNQNLKDYATKSMNKKSVVYLCLWKKKLEDWIKQYQSSSIVHRLGQMSYDQTS
jgi:hypothetical protein